MRKLEENHTSLNLKTNMNEDLNKDNNLLSNQNTKNESIGILFNTIHFILAGLSSFHLKYIILEFDKEYDIYVFTILRNLTILLISYFLIHRKHIELTKLENIQNKFWFGVRTIGQFFAAITFLNAISYLRTATAMTISALSPAIVLILGTIILKEKFHVRYVIGLFICLSGALLIINSEKRVPLNIDKESNEDELVNESSMSIIRLLSSEVGSSNEVNIIKGCLWSFTNLLIFSLLSTSSKILIKEHIGFENQNFYIALIGIIFSSFFYLFDGKKNAFSLSFLFIFNCFISGFIFFITTVFLIESLRYIDLNKTTPLSFLSTIVTFLLGTLFLGETMFLYDVIGSSIIIIYNILNYKYKAD